MQAVGCAGRVGVRSRPIETAVARGRPSRTRPGVDLSQRYRLLTAHALISRGEGGSLGLFRKREEDPHAPEEASFD